MLCLCLVCFGDCFFDVLLIDYLSGLHSFGFVAFSWILLDVGWCAYCDLVFILLTYLLCLFGVIAITLGVAD